MAEEEETPQTNNAYDQAISFIVNLFDPGFTTEISGLSTRLKESCENLVINEYIDTFKNDKYKINSSYSFINFDKSSKNMKSKKYERNTFIQTFINDILTTFEKMKPPKEEKGELDYRPEKQKTKRQRDIVDDLYELPYKLIVEISEICIHMTMYKVPDIMSGGLNVDGMEAIRKIREKEKFEKDSKEYRRENQAKERERDKVKADKIENAKKNNAKYKQINNIKTQVDNTFKSTNNMNILEWVNQKFNQISDKDLNQITDLIQLPIYNVVLNNDFYYKNEMSTAFKKNNNITNIEPFENLISLGEISFDDKMMPETINTKSQILMDFIYMYFQYSLFFHIIKLFTENMPTDANAAKKFIKELYIKVINKIQSKLNPGLFDTTQIPDVVSTGGRRRHLKTRRRTRFRKAKKLKSKSKTKSKTKTKKRRHTKKNKYL